MSTVNPRRPAFALPHPPTCAKALATLFALALLVGAPTFSLHASSLQNAVWDDGRAEFAAYEIDWARYGRSYPGRALIVTVKEPWDPQAEVKSSSGSRIEVIKMNHQREVQTGIYRYHQMTSLYWDRKDGSLRKLKTTHQDACGQSSAHWKHGLLETRSYFHGDDLMDWQPKADERLEDGLALRLRDWVQNQVPDSIQLAPSFMSDRFGELSSHTVRLRREPAAVIEVPAGTFPGVEILIEDHNRTMSFVFHAESPHELLRMSDGEGTIYRLAKVERLPYWSLTSPRHETWWPENLR